MSRCSICDWSDDPETPSLSHTGVLTSDPKKVTILYTLDNLEPICTLCKEAINDALREEPEEGVMWVEWESIETIRVHELTMEEVD